MIRSIRLVVASSSVIALLGCATQISVKDVVANPEAHLGQFTPAALSSDVLKALPRAPATANKVTRFEIQSEWKEASTDEKAPRNLKAKAVFLNVGDGLFSFFEEVANNDIPFRINYRLAYQGMTPLKWQNVFLNSSRSDMAFLVKRVQRADPIPASRAPGGKLEFQANTGTEVQVANYLDRRDTCTVGATHPARDIHSAFTGQAVDILCDLHGANGQLTGKITFGYLENYGLALRTAYSDSRTQSTVTVTSVRMQ